MTTGPSNLYDLAQTLLAATVSAFATDGVTLPARQYVTNGSPVAECESLVVAWERVWFGLAGTTESPIRFQSAGTTRMASLSIWLFRCVPTFEGDGLQAATSPKTTDLNASAEQIMTDAYVLHRGIGRARGSGQIRDVCEQLDVAGAEPVQPSGGIGGTRLNLVAELT